jgi:hypothetical protein
VKNFLAMSMEDPPKVKVTINVQTLDATYDNDMKQLISKALKRGLSDFQTSSGLETLCEKRTRLKFEQYARQIPSVICDYFSHNAI